MDQEKEATIMGIVGDEYGLSSFHVRWSPADGAFVARSDRYPGLIAYDEWSSLAAIDALMDLIEHMRSHDHPADRPAA
jgi:hypothetical protein